MPNIQYSSSPNETTAFVVQDGGQKNRAVLTAAQDTSTLELPKNPNSTKGYVTVDGKKHRVVLTAEIGNGGGGGGSVTSVNGQTGTVVLDAEDVGAVPQYTTMPTASASYAGTIAQYAGEASENYEQGYFYICNPVYVDSSATITQTTGSGLTDLAVDVATFETAEQPSGDETVNFVAAIVSESINPTQFQFDTATIEINPTTFLSVKTELYSGDWANVVRIYFSYDGDNDSFGAAVFDADNNELSNSGGLNPTFFGISVVSGTLPSSGSWGTNLAYTPVSVQWSKGGNTVTISDYGITYSGTPVDGDVLTVVYTAPTITDYAWEQIDVQPASASGIEWDATIDLPDTYDGSSVNAMWTIAGGLPDGKYEFYFQTKCTNDSATTTPFQMVTYKIVLSIYSNEYQERYFKGFYAPVIDGNFMPDGNYVLSATSSYWNLKLTVVGSDLVMWGNDRPFFQTDIPQYRGYTAVNECFKLSKIVNIETGEEYSATGSILTNNPSGSDITGYGLEYRLYQEQYIPSMQVYNQYEISELATQNAGIILYLQNEIEYKNIKSLNISLSHPDSNAEFEVNLTFGAYGKDCVQEIVKATGVFANCYVGYVEGFNTYITGFDDVLAQTLTGWFNINSGSIASAQISNSMTVITGTVIPYTQGGNKAYRFDTPTVNSIGNILQYVGTTDANYTNGYFYKATGNIVNVPDSATMTVSSYNDITVTVNAPALVTALATIYGRTEEDTRKSLTGNDAWVIDYDFDNGNITGVSWYLGALSDASVLSCFTVSVTGSYSGTWEFGCTMAFTAGHTEVQNGSWVQVNVQSGATTPSTMPTLTVAGWSSNTQTVTVNGVTTTNNVLVAPAPASSADWTSAGVICTAQGTDSLTFTCTQTPSNDITVNVCILG